MNKFSMGGGKLLLILFVMLFSVVTKVKAAISWNEVGDYNWMRYIDSNMRISQINIPGSHDSGAIDMGKGEGSFLISLFTKTQDLTIFDQLIQGTRYLDIRLAWDVAKRDVIIVHGVINTSITFADVLNDIYYFLSLKDNNGQRITDSEAIVLSLKIDRSGHDNEIISRVMEYISQNPTYWFTNRYIPTLAEVRGKIVLATRFTSNFGLSVDWNDMGEANRPQCNVCYKERGVQGLNSFYNVVAQDYYSISPENKWNVFSGVLANLKSSANTILINFLSISNLDMVGTARSLNNKLLNVNTQIRPENGWIIVDFTRAEIARKIYRSNIISSY